MPLQLDMFTVYSQQTASLERVKELVLEAEFFPVVNSDDGNVYISPLDPKSAEFYQANLPINILLASINSVEDRLLMASREGEDYRLTVAGILFLANEMREG